MIIRKIFSKEFNNETVYIVSAISFSKKMKNEDVFNSFLEKLSFSLKDYVVKTESSTDSSFYYDAPVCSYTEINDYMILRPDFVCSFDNAIKFSDGTIKENKTYFNKFFIFSEKIDSVEEYNSDDIIKIPNFTGKISFVYTQIEKCDDDYNSKEDEDNHFVHIEGKGNINFSSIHIDN